MICLILPGTSKIWDGYYKSLSLETNHIFPLLIKEYGWAHIVYVIYIVLATFAPLGILIFSVLRKKKLSYRNVLMLGLAVMALLFVYIAEMIFNFPLEIMPAGFVIVEILILSIIRRIGLYDVLQISMESKEASHEYGFVVFDNKGCYMGANDTAKYYFPELNELDIDKPPSDGFIKDTFYEWIEASDDNRNKTQVYNRRGKSLLCKLRPYLDYKNNKKYGYIVDIHDDTQNQRFIEMLNSANVNLEDAVKKANSANRAKSQFLANMSHEIRTPINAILGMNEIALRECEDEKVLTYLQDVKNAGENLLYIINDILDFSRIEAGRISIVQENYETARLFKDIYELIKIRTDEKELELVVNISPSIPKTLYGDSNRVRQIIVNLLSNSVKYTHSGKIALDVKSEPTSDPGTIRLMISVSDTGIGIKQEDIRKLFDSFERVDEQRNRSIQGTGLGLAITKRLVSKIGGTISVESVYNEGSTFFVEIKQDVVDATPIGDFRGRIKAKKSHSGNKYKSSIDLAGKDVLIVDDSKVNLLVAKGLLKPTGANIKTVKSGMECLDEIMKKHYDIILLDHMMPEMDGIETMQRARAMNDNKSENAIIIALTANAISGVKELYIEAGFDDYVSKPINSEELEKTLSKYI